MSCAAMLRPAAPEPTIQISHSIRSTSLTVRASINISRFLTSPLDLWRPRDARRSTPGQQGARRGRRAVGGQGRQTVRKFGVLASSRPDARAIAARPVWFTAPAAKPPENVLPVLFFDQIPRRDRGLVASEDRRASENPARPTANGCSGCMAREAAHPNYAWHWTRKSVPTSRGSILAEGGGPWSPSRSGRWGSR
jgi:hypothetical protein